MEFSEVGVFSGLSSVEGSPDHTSREGEEDRRIVIVICCLILLLLVLLSLMFTSLFIEDQDDDLDSSETPKVIYASSGRSSVVNPMPPVRTASTVITPGTGGTLGTMTTTSTTTTTTEDIWRFSQDYTKLVWRHLHYYVCPFWSEKQGFVSHRRTYGIAYFPYMFCHYAMYCCYKLDDSMQLQPERPHVDLSPINAVRRMSGFKAENYHLKTWLVLRGEDAVFLRLVENRNQERATFQKNALAWMKDNNYDGIRIWWTNAPESLNRSFAELYNDTNDVFQPNNRTFGMLIPYNLYRNEAYNTSKLAHRRALHTIVMYPEYPRELTARTRTTTYTIRELVVYPVILNQTDRPTFVHLLPFVALTYKIDPADCANTGSIPYNIKPLDYGPPGPLTKTPGILSLPEVCDIVDSTWRTESVVTDSAYLRPSYKFACKGEDVIAYTTGADAMENLLALDERYLDEVFGVMNPEYDDFPGICPSEVGPTGFPTVRTIFDVILH